MATPKCQVKRSDPGSTVASRKKNTYEEDRPAFPNKKNAISLRKTSITNVKAFEQEENPEYPEPFSPASSTQNSSEGSQESQSSFMSKVKTQRSCSSQNERDSTPVVTRSMLKHYASVGAVHNKVDLRKELRVRKKWPASSAYSIPGPPPRDTELKEVMTTSFNQVMNFCKDVAVYKRSNPSEETRFGTEKEPNSFVDLSPYLTQESFTGTRREHNEIAVNLSEDFLSHKLINIVAVDEDKGTVTIQSKADAQETVTLYSGQTYLIDNKYFASDKVDIIDLNNSSHSPSLDPRIGFKNDHNYSIKMETEFEKSWNVIEGLEKPSSIENITQSEFNIKEALNSLLLSTATLRCLVCNETPQEMINLLENAKSKQITL